MLRNSETGYGLVAITFHWVIALMFLGQAGLGLFMTGLEPDDPLDVTQMGATLRNHSILVSDFRCQALCAAWVPQMGATFTIAPLARAPTPMDATLSMPHFRCHDHRMGSRVSR